MAESIILETQARTVDGSRGARRLRKQGLIPAVLYGHKEAVACLALPQTELSRAINHGIHVLDLKSDGKLQKVLIREVQWDHLGMEIVHVDFARISETERVKVTVPLKLHGTAPGVTAGGVVNQPIHTLEIECLAIRIPDSIRVSIAELQMDGVVHIRDLVLPEGVQALGEPDAVVVQVVAKQLEEEAAPAAPSDKSEPEVIGRTKEEEEEEAKE